MSFLGRIDEFRVDEEAWDSYIERFELFISSNDIKEDKKVSIFLTTVGVKTYSLLRDLCSPAKPATKKFEELTAIIKEHLYPKPNIIAERYKFSQRNQLPNELVSEYFAQLKKLSISCDFKDNLHDQLRDRLVSGLIKDNIKQRLLTESDLTLEKALQIATSFEAAEKNAATLGLSTTYSPAVNQIVSKDRVNLNQPSTSRSTNQRGYELVCYCCGVKGNHTTNKCKYRNLTCNFCSKKGHLQKACRQYKNNYSANQQQTEASSSHVKRSYVNELKTSDTNYQPNTCSDDEHKLFTMDSSTLEKVAPITLHLDVSHVIISFEIDTGAAVSVISELFYKEHFQHIKLNPTNLVLNSYTHEKIMPLGYLSVDVKYQGLTQQLPLYVIPNGSNPLLGRDWIKYLKLLISVTDKNTMSFVSNSHCLSNSSVSDIVSDLFKEYSNVFTDKIGEYTGEPARLVLKDGASPKFYKPRPIPFSLKEKVERELNNLVDQNIISLVFSSAYGTPIVPVLKKNNQVRICGDFKVTINPDLEVDRYPLPRIDDIFSALQKGDTFTKLDFSQAFLQIRLDDESKKLCTISTHKGLFVYNRVPFGVASAPGIFQRIIEQIILGIPGVVAFLDDILVTGPTISDHLSSLKEVCKRLSENGLTLCKEKCNFFQKSVEYLGFVIDKHGLSTASGKVQAVIDAPVPTNVTQLKAFLGLVNYYGKFISNLSTILSPLYQLLKKGSDFNFDMQCMKSFNMVKDKLVSSEVLAHYDPDKKLKLACDASGYGLGCVLSRVEDDNSERPIAYASRTLSKSEQMYSQIDKEALSLVFGVQKFNQYLWGRHFTLCTDHKPLLSIFGSKTGLPAFAASRLQRYALYLSGYDFDICYVKSHLHGNADALSRLPLNLSSTVNEDDNTVNDYHGTYLHCLSEAKIPLNFEDVKKEINTDSVLGKILNYVMYGWSDKCPDELFRPYFQRKDEISVENGVLLWGYRVIIPDKFRKMLLDELHSGHLGIVKMKQLARSYFWWPAINNDIENIANSCSSCLLEKQNPSKTILHVWNYPEGPWSRIHVDFLGPFKSKMYLIVVDAYTKWLEVLEVSSTCASQTINHLRQVFARFGLPKLLVSDNGPPFTSSDFKHFLSMNGIKHSLIAPYHPQTKGLAENSVKLIKSKLKCASLDNENFDIALSRLLFSYRTSVHASTGETPAKLMFNRSFRTRFDLLRPDLRSVVTANQSKQISHSHGSQPRELFIDQPVLCRDYRSTHPRWVEGTIFKKLGPVTYLIKLSHSDMIWKRHIDQISQHVPNLTPVPPVPVTPPAVSTYVPPIQIPVPKTVSEGTTSTQPQPVPHSPTPPTSPIPGKRYPQRNRQPVVKLNL